MSKKSDEVLIKGIRGDAPSRNEALRYIYQESGWRSHLLQYVQKQKGSAEEGKDLFQECIVLFDRNIRAGRFSGKSTLKTYFFGIAKRRWWKKLEKKKKAAVDLPESTPIASKEDIEMEVISAEKKHFLEQAINQLGKRCQEILKLFKLDYSNKEIAAVVGLSSAQMAKKESYRCRKRFRKLLKEQPVWEKLIR